jgi:hypothetical protein
VALLKRGHLKASTTKNIALDVEINYCDMRFY